MKFLIAFSLLVFFSAPARAQHTYSGIESWTFGSGSGGKDHNGVAQTARMYGGGSKNGSCTYNGGNFKNQDGTIAASMTCKCNTKSPSGITCRCDGHGGCTISTDW
jgi:hypothetical protein